MAAEPQDAPRHAGQVVRRVLLRRNIARRGGHWAGLASPGATAPGTPETPRPHRAAGTVLEKGNRAS